MVAHHLAVATQPDGADPTPGLEPELPAGHMHAEPGRDFAVDLLGDGVHVGGTGHPRRFVERHRWISSWPSTLSIGGRPATAAPCRQASKAARPSGSVLASASRQPPRPKAAPGDAVQSCASWSPWSVAARVRHALAGDGLKIEPEFAQQACGQGAVLQLVTQQRMRAHRLTGAAAARRPDR
jgi:hypothetical protein